MGIGRSGARVPLQTARATCAVGVLRPDDSDVGRRLRGGGAPGSCMAPHEPAYPTWVRRRPLPWRATIVRMSRVAAKYEDGLLHPTKALPLKPGELVTIIVVRQPDPARWDLGRLPGTTGEDDELAELGLGDWAAALDREDRG